MTAAESLRAQLDTGWVVAAGCFDALSARLAEYAGFETLHVTGFGVETTQAAAPDIGLLTLTEMTAHVARMTAAVRSPMIVDVDTGYGGVHNVMRAIREIERAGAAGLHIEDQTYPKQGPGVSGRNLLPVPEAVGRVEAALAARSDPSFVVIARSDALSYDEVIDRSNRYLQAGADVAMPLLTQVDGRSTRQMPPDEQMEWYQRLARDIDGPVLGTRIPAGYTVDDMRDAGFAVMILATVSFNASVTAMLEALRAARVDGTARAYFDEHPIAVTSAEIMEICGLADYLERERRFGAPGTSTIDSTGTDPKGEHG